MNNEFLPPGMTFDRGVVGHTLFDRFHQGMRQVGQALGVTALVLEITPANEAIRFGTAAAVQAASENPVLSTVAFSAATFAIEGAAATATAYMLNTETGHKVVDTLNAKINKAGLTETLETNFLTETGIAVFGGSALATVAKHRQDPARTPSQNCLYGLKNAAALTVVTAPLGYAVAEGIAEPSLEKAGLVAAGLVALYGVGKYMKSKFKRNVNENSTPHVSERKE